jgi:hypothetical protein
MEPHQARDLINKKIFSIEAEKPVHSTKDITIKYENKVLVILPGNDARAATPAKESLDVAIAALRGVFIRKTLNEAQSGESNL